MSSHRISSPGRVGILAWLFGAIILSGSVPVLSQPALAVVTNSPLRQTRVSGSFSLPAEFDVKKVKVVESRLILLEEYVPDPLPAPKEFANWDASKKAEWFAKWERTPAGQDYQKQEERRFAKLKKYETKVDRNWGFQFDRVAPGNYDLAGEIILQRGKQEYMAEFFAVVKVSRVEKLELSSIKLQCHRLLKVGDTLPSWPAVKGGLAKSDLISSPGTLVVFYSQTRGLEANLVRTLNNLKSVGRLRTVGIEVAGGASGSSKEGPQLVTSIKTEVKGADDPLCRAWGVRRLPSLWLVDRQGKVVAVPTELNNPAVDLSQLISQKLK